MNLSFSNLRRRIFNKKVLVYVGMHRGAGFDKIFKNYTVSFGFEADPELFHYLEQKYRRERGVKLFNAAVTGHDGQIDFHIASNDGGSSSVGKFRPDWDHFKTKSITPTKTIKVSSINLETFLQKQGIDYIDEYISDIQGMDLEVLKTLEP